MSVFLVLIFCCVFISAQPRHRNKNIRNLLLSNLENSNKKFSPKGFTPYRNKSRRDLQINLNLIIDDGDQKDDHEQKQPKTQKFTSTSATPKKSHKKFNKKLTKVQRWQFNKMAVKIQQQYSKNRRAGRLGGRW